MSIYALVQKNKVINLIVADEEWIVKEWNAKDYYESTELHPIVIGSELINGRFFAPQPYPSWTLNTLTVQWEAPIIKPELTEAEVLAGSSYRWDEETLGWILETPEPLT